MLHVIPMDEVEKEGRDVQTEGDAKVLTRLQPAWRGPKDLATRSQLSDEVASYVRELIITGQHQQGDRLRLEPLAEALGVSLTPVREGLLALRGEGFVTLQPRRGFVVSAISPADLKDLFFVQAFVAGELAARAAKKILPEQVAALEGLQDELQEGARRGDTDAMESANHSFHRSINIIADAPKLVWVLSTVVRYAPRRFYASVAGWQEASVEGHEAIIAALLRREPEKARKEMTNHIQHAGTLLVDNLEALWAERDRGGRESDLSKDGPMGLRRSASRGYVQLPP